jgi:uncharacterized membrane protein required for colicin V production
MTWVDFVVIALLIYTIWQGVLRGWVAALFGAVIIAASWLAAIALLPYYGKSVESLPLQADWARTIAFGFVLIGFYVILSLIANAFLGGKRPRVEAQVAGAIVGVLRGVIGAMVVLGLLAAVPVPEGDALKRDINASRLGRPILEWERQFMLLVPGLPPIGPDRRI